MRFGCPWRKALVPAAGPDERPGGDSGHDGPAPPSRCRTCADWRAAGHPAPQRPAALRERVFPYEAALTYEREWNDYARVPAYAAAGELPANVLVPEYDLMQKVKAIPSSSTRLRRSTPAARHRLPHPGHPAAGAGPRRGGCERSPRPRRPCPGVVRRPPGPTKVWTARRGSHFTSQSPRLSGSSSHAVTRTGLARTSPSPVGPALAGLSMVDVMVPLGCRPPPSSPSRRGSRGRRTANRAERPESTVFSRAFGTGPFGRRPRAPWSNECDVMDMTKCT